LFRMDQKTGDFLTVSALRCTSAPVVEGDKVFVTCRSDEGNACSESVATLDKNTFKTTAKFLTKQATYLDKTVQSGSKLKEESMILDSGNGFSGGAPGNSGWEAAYDNIGQSNVSSLQAFQGSRILMIGGKTYNTMGDELICSDPGNGKKLWTTLVEGDMHRTGGHLATPPIKAGNYLIVATYSGEVIVYNPENGRVAEKFRTAGDPIRYAPIAHEGWIYVTTTTGKLYGFKSDNPNITGWPMWGANPGHTNTVN
jgi:outer membrane protein assembly factor BamB